MEAATTTEQPPEAELPERPEAPEVPTDVETSRGDPDAVKNPEQMFKFSGFVHVGPGADECPNNGVGCTNPEHFHAWTRLPNQFQHADIREKGLAAKARKLRALKDPESDAYAILDGALMQVEHEGDRETLIDEIVAKKWMDRRIEAMRDVEAAEDDDGTKPFEFIERDRERFAELRAMDAEQRPQAEMDELEAHLQAYSERVGKLQDDNERPERESLADREMSELIDLIREDRIQAEASAAFQGVFSIWEWYVGTLKPVAKGSPKERVFANVQELQDAPPEVVEALRVAFTELEVAFQRGQTGNS